MGPFYKNIIPLIVSDNKKNLDIIIGKYIIKYIIRGKSDNKMPAITNLTVT